MPTSETASFPVESSTHTSTRRFPLSLRDCKVLTAILNRLDVFDHYDYPRKALCNELAEQIEMDPDEVYYSLKFLRMARFF
jgi:hypothetical protein